MPMVSLLPKDVTIVEKDRLFYDQWEYCVSFFPVKECSLLTKLDHAAIDRGVAWRNGYRGPGDMISPNDVKKLHNICDVLLSTKVTYKTRREWYTLFLYMNDLTLAQEILDNSFVKLGELKQAVITKPRDVLVRVNPVNKYRTYFRSRRYTAEQKAILLNFYQNNKKDIVFGESFRYWLIGRGYMTEWTQAHYYIDHDSISWLSMINMLFPGSTSKTLSIQAAK
jgi:hypothetical protein